MFTSSWFRAASKRPRPATRLALERLEDRDCPSGSYLLVAEYDNHQVLRYDANTGAFVDQFVPKHSGGLKEPQSLIFGPHDHDLYVGSGHFGGPLKAVLRYDGASGEFVDEFTEGGHLESVHGVIFGPDGNLYVGDRVGTFGKPEGGRILRFNGVTGAFMDEFVPLASGGLRHPFGIVFAPDKKGKLDLFVADGPGNILRYDGTTGAFVEEFVPLGRGGLDLPVGLSVGPDGHLYVADLGFRTGIPKVLRFQGPTGRTPGAFIDVFVSGGTGGLRNVQAAIFGPDGNGDGRQDLYVSNSQNTGIGQDKAKDGNVKRYDGVTGAFIDTFVSIGSGGLNNPSGLTFTETDPMTLAYRGGDTLTAASYPAIATREMLAANQVQPLLSEALTRWQFAGVNMSVLGNIQIQISNLGGNTLGLASGHTIWLDDNAAGWGWFVDPTPRNDSEFRRRGNQGEMNRMDLLTVLTHEIGHVMGYEHEQSGVMEDTLVAGTRRMPGAGQQTDWLAAIDLLFAEWPLSKRRR